MGRGKIVLMAQRLLTMTLKLYKQTLGFAVTLQTSNRLSNAAETETD